MQNAHCRYHLPPFVSVTSLRHIAGHVVCPLMCDVRGPPSAHRQVFVPHRNPPHPSRLKIPPTMNSISQGSPPFHVWAFVIGSSSGPLAVSVRACTRCFVEIIDMHNIFPPDSMIDSTHVRVVNDIYIVYFDWLRHVEDRDNAMYVFIRVADNSCPLSICPEDEIADLLLVLDIVDQRYLPINAQETL
ncbi:hypothetical protein BKA82DRAFT_29054 [Pisolithus tinctorius]|uniref:Uncharacterized protein n=1 Tax=Pisolithus tinctorius Marx 270 TaxID=870435 RepID=A0A0C3JUG3_PISTI|nr:hypothetical protein BKA82DRAFT_29054 [Pisolithus tinctorius]KIO01097.1 hypothetical protein M404DRAFT_29054 [Pisolithus tinctorius Marx 270]